MARRTPDVARRLRLGLVLAGVLLVAATGWRTSRLVDSRPPADVVVRPLDLDSLDGGLLLTPSEGGWTARSLRSGADVELAAGRSTAVGRLGVEVVGGDGVRRTEIMRVPWSMFADERAGFTRIDFGADPLGVADGVRDRVVVPAGDGGERAWFHLAPPRTDGRFEPGDAGQALLVAERDGLTVTGEGLEASPLAGESVPVPARFEVGDGGSVRLTVRWQRVARAEPVVGRGGVILGYREGSGTDFVVMASQPGEAQDDRTRVRVSDRAGVELADVSAASSRPLLLHGRRDRLSPLRGRVLPPSAPNEELEEAVRTGLDEGWIRVGLERTEVEIPAAEDGGPRRDLGWALSRSVVDLMGGYDRARAPVGLKLGVGVRPSAASVSVDGERQPLRFDRQLDAWLPSARPEPGREVIFDLPVMTDSGSVSVQAAFPVSWRTRGAERWTHLPPPARGRWASLDLSATRGDVLQVRLETTTSSEVIDRVGASIAGAPDGTFLVPAGARAGTRAFESWDRVGTAADTRAERLWARLPGDRWSVLGDAPEADPSRGGRLFVRVPIDARTGGGTALDLTLPGAVLSASWNDAELVSGRLPRSSTGGTTRLSVETRPGRNLLALELELPATAPPKQAGGVRFVVGEAGNPSALDRRVADRRARAPVVHADVDSRTPIVPTPPAVVVETGLPGLPRGTRWQIGSAPGQPGRSSLLLAAGDGVVARSELGRLELSADGLTWWNGPLRLGVVRRVETDPDGPPLAGFAVAPKAPQPLGVPGDAIIAPDFRISVEATGLGGAAGERLILRDGQLLSLREAGRPDWVQGIDEEAAPGTRLDLFTPDGRDLIVQVSRPATLWSTGGEPTSLEPSVPADWPPGSRLLVAGTPLRLRRPLDHEPGAAGPRPEWLAGVPTSTALTLVPALQAAAERVLDDELTRLPERDGDTMDLRGVVLAFDPHTGDVLACAARRRDGADPRSRLLQPCWQDGGVHPGSTFKIATGSAGLVSTDPAVRAMLVGRLPRQLRAGGPVGTMKGLKLPALPDGGDDIRLRARVSNHKGGLMPVDTDLGGALRSSYNVWFGYMGLLLHRPLREGWSHAAIADEQARLDAWPVARIARQVGFDTRLDLGAGLVGTGGHVPEVAATSDAQIAARSIGQDAVTATPLGVASLLGMVVEGGQVARPRLAADKPVERVQVLPSAAADALASGLSQVVARGTAARALGDNPWREHMLGKTGSAQRIDGQGLHRTDAWFAAAMRAPEDSEDSPVVIVCLLPGAGLGGRHAAEVVDGLSREVLRVRGWVE
jgi:hypothetical protein